MKPKTHLNAKAKRRRNIGEADLHCKRERAYKINSLHQKIHIIKNNPLTKLMNRRNIGKSKLTIVAKVTEMNTREALLRFISRAVPIAVGTTVKGKFQP